MSNRPAVALFAAVFLCFSFLLIPYSGTVRASSLPHPLASGSLLRVSYPSGSGAVSVSANATGNPDGSVTADITLSAKRQIVYDMSADTSGTVMFGSREIRSALNRPAVFLGADPNAPTLHAVRFAPNSHLIITFNKFGNDPRKLAHNPNERVEVYAVDVAEVIVRLIAPLKAGEYLNLGDPDTSRTVVLELIQALKNSGLDLIAAGTYLNRGHGEAKQDWMGFAGAVLGAIQHAPQRFIQVIKKTFGITLSVAKLQGLVGHFASAVAKISAAQVYYDLLTAPDFPTIRIDNVYRPQTAPPVTTRTVTVSATQGWQDTHVSVRQNMHITAKVVGGQWTNWVGHAPYNPGTGGTYICANAEPASQCVEPLPTAPSGALIGGVFVPVNTADSTPRAYTVPLFLIGSGATVTAANPGELYLRINDSDDGLSDNAGSLTVRISVTQ